MIDNLISLNDENFELYAAKAYTNMQCINYKEFKNDLNLLNYINKSASYKSPNLRLLINQIILFFNVFKTKEATNMIIYKTRSENLDCIVTILYYLSFIEDGSILKRNFNSKLYQDLMEL